jgi:hypothetical protein
LDLLNGDIPANGALIVVLEAPVDGLPLPSVGVLLDEVLGILVGAEGITNGILRQFQPKHDDLVDYLG